MTSYIQTTIHSVISKYQNTKINTFGKLYRGRNKMNQSIDTSKQVISQINILPKPKKIIKNKINNKNNQIVLMQSLVFPSIYFKKTTMRNVLKQFQFPQNVRALLPHNQCIPLIYQIVSNLFNQINFYIFNILIGQDILTQSYYVFFSDSDNIPYTKCCNASVYVQLLKNGSGKILCNAINCKQCNLAQFLINFEDGKRLWKNITYFAEASDKDKQLRNKISKMIRNGKYKRSKLSQVVENTSKEIVQLYYESKKANSCKKQQEEQQKTFLTVGNNKEIAKYKENQQQNLPFKTQRQVHSNCIIELPDNIQVQQKIDYLKFQLDYISKLNPAMEESISQSLVDNGIVFHNNFQMINKIDQYMLTHAKKNKINFPKIMNDIQRKHQLKNKPIKDTNRKNIFCKQTINKSFM